QPDARRHREAARDAPPHEQARARRGERGRQVTSTRLAFALVLAAATTAWAQETKKDRPIDKVPIPPMKPFDPPRATPIALPNGIAVYVLEDHELPLVELRAVIRAGGVWDPD